jgi:glycosyltransferase involved in cell wall biosynthesis
VIPAYNEYTPLESLRSSRRISRALDIGDAEVIVVDDGSIDATADLVREWSVRWPALQAGQLPSNQGKGAALRAGIAATQVMSWRSRTRTFPHRSNSSSFC